MPINQLKGFDKKFISKKDAKELPEEEYIKLLEFNIDEFDYAPTDEEMSILVTESKKLEKAIFGGFPLGLRTTMKTADEGERGKEIAFNNGKYETSNLEEFNFLKDKAKHPYPGQTVTLLEEIYEG